MYLSLPLQQPSNNLSKAIILWVIMKVIVVPCLPPSVSLRDHRPQLEFLAVEIGIKENLFAMRLEIEINRPF
jgi:hypothetical protein